MIQKFRLTLLTSMLLAASSVNATVLQETLNFTKSATDDNSYSITVDGYGIKVRPTKEDGPAEVNLTGSSVNVSVDLTLNNSISGVFASSGATLNLGGNNTKDINISVVAKSNSQTTPLRQPIGIWAYKYAEKYDQFKSLSAPKIVVTSDNLTINVESEDKDADYTAYGIIAANNTEKKDGQTLAEDERATVLINSKNTVVNVTSKTSGGGLVAMSQGVLKVNGILEVNARNAIITRGDSIIKINESGTNQVVLNGDIKYSFDGPSSGTGVDSDVLINSKGNNSQWTGNVTTGWESETKPESAKLTVTQFKLALADGAQWNPTIIAQVDEETKGLNAIPVNNLAFNNGVINITKAQDQKVEIEKLQGTGGVVNVAATTDGTTISSAQLKADAVEGAPHFTVNAVGLTSDEITNQKEAMESFYANALDLADGSDATATLNIAEGGAAGALTAEVAKDGSMLVKEAQNTVNSSLIDIAASNYLFFRSQMNDVSARLGDLRSMPKTAGAWVRYYGGKNKYSSGNMSEKYNTVQFGGDGFINDNFYLGGTFSYTHGDGNLRNGSTDDKNFNFGIYGGWLGDSGQFVDVIIKRHRVKSDFSLYNTMGRNSGSFHNWGTSASVEAGWRLQCPDTGFYVEPQAELQFGRLDSVDYKTNKGVKVEQDSIDSFVGRAGVAVGYTFPEKKGNAYAKASVLHDWKGEVKSTFSSNGAKRTYRDDLGGTWGEFAVGGTFNPTKNISAYGQVKTSAGSPVRNPWQVSVGVRYSF